MMLALILVVSFAGGAQVGASVDTTADLANAESEFEEAFEVDYETDEPVKQPGSEYLQPLVEHADRVDRALASVNPLSEHLDAAAERFSRGLVSTMLGAAGWASGHGLRVGYALGQMLPTWAVVYPLQGLTIGSVLGVLGYQLLRLRSLRGAGV